MSVPNLRHAFAATYVDAREKFLAAALRAGATIGSHEHPDKRGAEGETLAVDIAILGPPDAAAQLWVLSGTHGAEGFCGSGVQVALLDDPSFHAALARSGAAVFMYHAVNPYGFSHLQRTDESNVDLNRNFHDFAQRTPLRNDAYAEVHDLMVPAVWPPPPENEARLRDYVATRGARALQSAVTGGQSDFPTGLFFGGVAPAWGNRTLRAALRRHAASCRRLGWIDVHTALGPSGHAEKILSGPNDPALIARAATWFGNDVTNFYDGTSTSAVLTGVNFAAVLDECPAAEYTGIALEYGTLPVAEVLHALRGDAWLQEHPNAPAETRAAIKRLVREAFYTDTDDWRGEVYGQARATVFQALKGLAPPP